MFKQLITSVLAVIQFCVPGLSDLPSEPEHNTTLQSAYIVHAAGTYKGYSQTNSLEALENAYASGNRYIELDFSFTSDLRPVCIHDWNHLAYSGFDDAKPTEKQFMESGVYSVFSSINLDILSEFMMTHDDLYIISDVKELNVYFSGIISREYPQLMDRFIIQVYSEEEYGHISKLGFENIIFSLYRLDWESKTDTDHLIEFAKNNRLFGYTFPAELCDIDGYVDNMLKSGVPLFVHTVNDKEKQKEYFDMGISGIYTDNVTHT